MIESRCLFHKGSVSIMYKYFTLRLRRTNEYVFLFILSESPTSIRIFVFYCFIAVCLNALHSYGGNKSI